MKSAAVVALCGFALLAVSCGDDSAGLGGAAGGTGGAGGAAGAAGLSTAGAAGGAGEGGTGGPFECGGLEFEQLALYDVQCRLALDGLPESIPLDLTAKVYGSKDAGPLRPGEPSLVTSCGQVDLPQETLNAVGKTDPQVTAGFVDFSVTNAVPEELEHSVPLGSVQATVVVSVEETELVAKTAGEVVIEPARARIAILVTLLNSEIPIDLQIPGDFCGGFVLSEGSAPLSFAAISVP